MRKWRRLQVLWYPRGRVGFHWYRPPAWQAGHWVWVLDLLLVQVRYQVRYPESFLCR